MRKGTYNIEIVRLVNGKKVKEEKEINGYIVEYDGLKFGVDKRWPKSNNWVITELRSGYQVGDTIPKLKDFWTEMPKRIEIVKKALQNYDIKSINDVDKL